MNKLLLLLKELIPTLILIILFFACANKSKKDNSISNKEVENKSSVVTEDEITEIENKPYDCL